MPTPVHVQDITRIEAGGADPAVTGVLAATPTPGNYLFVFMLIGEFFGAITTITPPAGWALIGPAVIDIGDTKVGLWGKIAGASEPTSFAFDHDGSSDYSTSYLAEWANVDPTTSIDVAAAAIVSAFGEDPIVEAAITTVTDNAVDIVLCHHNFTTTLTAGPSTYTTNEATTAGIDAFSKVIASAGSTGTRSMTPSDICGNIRVSFALRPTANAGPAVPPDYTNFPKWQHRRAA